MSDLVSYLFKTNALRVSPADKPFWYTSGKFGPFYILEIPYIQKQIFKILTWKIKYLRNNKVKLFIYYWKIE